MSSYSFIPTALSLDYRYSDWFFKNCSYYCEQITRFTTDIPMLSAATFSAAALFIAAEFDIVQFLSHNFSLPAVVQIIFMIKTV
jgi:hypothetical protein